MNQNVFNIRSSSSSTVKINGKTFVGDRISITANGDVTVDGSVTDRVVGDIKVDVKADVVESIEVAVGSVIINANKVGNTKVQSGDIECGDVTGDVTTQSGSVKCKKVGGRISVMSGDVSVG